MSIVSKIFSAGAGELVKNVGGVIDNLHTSKEEKMEADLSFYKDCEAFSENIKTVLSTERMNRKMDGAKFLQDTFASYKKLVEGNSIIERFKGNVTLYKDSICEQVEDMETFVVDHWNILFRPTLRRFKKKNAELIESVKQAGQDVKSIVEPVTNEVVDKVEEGTGWFKGKLNGLWGKDGEKEEEKKEEAGISMETVYTTVKDIPTMMIAKRDEPRKFAMSFVDKR